MPQLSIVIPTHNRPDMLKKAVESANAQTTSDLEVIVVDDGSSPPIADDCFDAKVSVHRHPSPRGASAARNTGISLAKGTYTAFLDDDDTLHPDYAERMLHFMENSGADIDFAWPSLHVIDIPTGKTSRAQHLPCLIRRNHSAPESSYAATAYTRTTGMIFRTASIREFNGFDETLSVSEDRELIFRMLSQGCGCGSVESALVNFFIHTGPRLSTDDNLLKQAKCDGVIAVRHADFIAQHPKLASRYLNLLARRQKDAGLFREYRSTLRTLLKINPTDVRALKRFALSLIIPTRHQSN
ncbi:glycosyltransferase family 2 protein [Marinobacter algicola]|nr:glycosyltransferase [Marinobacter algicola]